MNAQSQLSVAPQTNFVGFLNPESFEFSQRVANMLSNSTMVPEQYRAVTKVKAGKDSYGNMMYRDEPNPNGLLSNAVHRTLIQFDKHHHVFELWVISSYRSWRNLGVNYGVFSPKSATNAPIAPNYGQKKDLQVIDFNCKSLNLFGRYIQTRTGDLYDVNVAL